MVLFFQIILAASRDEVFPILLYPNWNQKPLGILAYAKKFLGGYAVRILRIEKCGTGVSEHIRE